MTHKKVFVWAVATLLFLLLWNTAWPTGVRGPLLFAGNAAGDQDVAQGAPQKTGKEAASELLQLFQRRWERTDVRGLLALLSDGGRVIMRVDFLGLNGVYGSGQAEYIMKEFFGKGIRNSFTISRYRELSGGVSAYAAGNITYLEKRSGLERKLLIFISLEERGGAWSVEELRITDD